MMILIGKKIAVPMDEVRSIILDGDIVTVTYSARNSVDLQSKSVMFTSEDEAFDAICDATLQCNTLAVDRETALEAIEFAGIKVEPADEDEADAEDVEVVPITEEMWDRFAAEAKALQDKAAAEACD
jgi:hypothetical protein